MNDDTTMGLFNYVGINTAAIANTYFYYFIADEIEKADRIKSNQQLLSLKKRNGKNACAGKVRKQLKLWRSKYRRGIFSMGGER